MLCGWVLYCVTVTKAMFLTVSALDITLSYEYIDEKFFLINGARKCSSSENVAA